ncbi:alpha/beta hydrolase fold domain-containing protein [Marinobacter sp. LN3S78]|uniref:alpha/beta hydrolase fold domain-containing protein n=1 Tax=Marinobacter sp. LN3S78 TaxID=3382300 RepID=UPI00387B1F28
MTFRTILIALLVIAGPTSPVFARGIPPVDVTVSGEASPELLADFRQALNRMANRQTNGAQPPSPARDEGLIDLEQFWKVEQDVPYAIGGDSPRQRLNITYPFEGEPPYRFIVHFHGGDWATGSRQSAANAPAYWAIYQGYAVVDVGYRLADKAQWPAQLHDAKAAIRFLRANADQYQLDAERIVVMGSGAGGHLAQMLAATNGDSAAQDPDMGYGDASPEVQGVVSWSGVSDITTMGEQGRTAADRLMGYPAYQSELALEASPVARVHENFPPILLLHGTNDRWAPFEQSARMAIRVNAATGRSTATLDLLINARHQDPRIGTKEIMSKSLNFVDRILFPDDGNPHRSTFYPGIQTTGTSEQP